MKRADTKKSLPGKTPPDPIAALLLPGRKTLYHHEIASRLRVTTEHVRKLVVAGHLKTVGKQISAESYEAFLRKRFKEGRR